MSPVPEIFHLLFRGSGMYLPVVAVCLVSGYVQKVVNFDSDFLGYILVLTAAWNSSQSCKAGGVTAFWLGRPFRTPVLGIYMVTVLFLSVCAYLAGAGIWWIINGLNPDLVFWYSVEKVPPLLFTGLLGLCLFAVTTSGSGLCKMLLWIAGLVIGGMALLLKISEKLYTEVADSVQQIFAMPTEPSAVFLFLTTGSLVLGCAIILRYMIRHKRLVFIGVTMLVLVLSLIFTRNTRIDFSFKGEEPVTLAAIKPKATLIKEAGEVMRKVDLSVSARKPADFFRINSNFGFGNKEDFYERRKAATFAALGLPFEKLDGFRVSNSLLPKVKGEIADIEYWTTEPVGDFSGEAIEGFGKQGVSDGANLVCFSGKSAITNPYRLLPAYAFNPAWVKYGDDFRHEFSVVAIDRKTGEQEYFHAARIHKGRWRADRDYRVVVHRQTHRQAVNLIVVD